MSKQRKSLALSGTLAGEGALLAAVIARAVKDATGRDAEHRLDARLYFLSDVYTAHLEALGFERDAVPVAFQNAGYRPKEKSR